MKLELQPQRFAVAKLPPAEKIPTWAETGAFSSISRNSDELSIVCEEMLLPKNIPAEKGWRLLKVRGPLDFGLIGVLESIARPLAKAQISIFTVSTFETDYVLVKETVLTKALEVLQQAGWEV